MYICWPQRVVHKPEMGMGARGRAPQSHPSTQLHEQKNRLRLLGPPVSQQYQTLQVSLWRKEGKGGVTMQTYQSKFRNLPWHQLRRSSEVCYPVESKFYHGRKLQSLSCFRLEGAQCLPLTFSKGTISPLESMELFS